MLYWSSSNFSDWRSLKYPIWFLKINILIINWNMEPICLQIKIARCWFPTLKCRLDSSPQKYRTNDFKQVFSKSDRQIIILWYLYNKTCTCYTTNLVRCLLSSCTAISWALKSFSSFLMAAWNRTIFSFYNSLQLTTNQLHKHTVIVTDFLQLVGYMA
jgi:hypothetical protein